MSKKVGIAHERAVMCSKVSERKLSTPTRDKIFQHLGSFDPEDHKTKEAEAKKITEIITSSKTEAEMIRRIEELD